MLPLKVNPSAADHHVRLTPGAVHRELAHAPGALGKGTARHIRKILEKTSNEWKESWKV